MQGSTSDIPPQRVPRRRLACGIKPQAPSTSHRPPTTASRSGGGVTSTKRRRRRAGLRGHANACERGVLGMPRPPPPPARREPEAGAVRVDGEDRPPRQSWSATPASSLTRWMPRDGSRSWRVHGVPMADTSAAEALLTPTRIARKACPRDGFTIGGDGEGCGHAAPTWRRSAVSPPTPASNRERWPRGQAPAPTRSGCGGRLPG